MQVATSSAFQCQKPWTLSSDPVEPPLRLRAVLFLSSVAFRYIHPPLCTASLAKINVSGSGTAHSWVASDSQQGATRATCEQCA